MENRVTNKLIGYLTDFKADLTKQIRDGLSGEHLIEYMYQYNEINLSEEDFHKRKRCKNLVPLGERCVAQRIDGTQCSRRKQIGKEYCGTHSKGQPYGNINPPPNDIGVSGTHHTKQIWCEAVNGIYYYIDGEGNVYKTEDIIMNLPNPKVIATYIKQGDEYKIPALFDK